MYVSESVSQSVSQSVSYSVSQAGRQAGSQSEIECLFTLFLGKLFPRSGSL